MSTTLVYVAIASTTVTVNKNSTDGSFIRKMAAASVDAKTTAGCCVFFVTIREEERDDALHL